MDRRQQKTRKAIFKAFRLLLEKKRYDHITVQDIIDEADVGRSTFYSHFETKDMLLNAMCDEIFHHLLDGDPCPWAGKDDDLEGKLCHTLWHVREEKSDLRGILLSDSGELFMAYFKTHLKRMFERYANELKTDIPKDFLLNHLSSGFAEAVKWWVSRDFQETPEQLARYFVRTIG